MITVTRHPTKYQYEQNIQTALKVMASRLNAPMPGTNDPVSIRLEYLLKVTRSVISEQGPKGTVHQAFCTIQGDKILVEWRPGAMVGTSEKREIATIQITQS